jgi:hypothetical protein
MPAGDLQSSLTGAWSASELAETARTANPPGVDSDVPDEFRFRSGVARLVQTRRMQDAHDDGLAIFLLTRLPSETNHSWERTPMLDNGLTQVSGRLWIVNPPVASGLSISIDGRTDQEVFELVTSELVLGEVPTIIVDYRTAIPQVRHYSNGLLSPDDYEAISLVSGSLPMNQILEEVERAYTEHLRTPEAQTSEGKLWKKSTHWWAASNAEKVVQLYLKVHLCGAFPLCKIREEQTQTSGRIDLEIEEPIRGVSGGFIRHALLELKVLRSHGESGKVYTSEQTLDWVKKGVEQASVYRQERGALASALCCFDLRTTDTGDDCFTHVSTMATSLQVTLRRWFVYASSAAFRQAVANSTS